MAYITGTDLAEGEEAETGMGAVSCRQGQHTRVAAPRKVGCGGSGSLSTRGEGGIGLKPGMWLRACQ